MSINIKLDISRRLIILIVLIAFVTIVSATNFNNNQLLINQSTGLQFQNTSINQTHIVSDSISSYNLSSPSGTINSSNNSITNTNNLHSSTSYIIYKCSWDSSLTCAENSSTRNLDYINSDDATVINLALATAGTPPKKKFIFIGNFTLSTEILPKNYSILYATQANFSLGNGVATTVNDGLVDIVMGNHDIDIIGGKWEGNSEGQTSWMVMIRLMGNDLTLSEAIINNSRGDCIFSRAPRNKVFNNNIGYCQDTGIVMGGLKTATNASYGKGFNNYIHDSVVGLDMSNDADYVEYYANTLRNITANGISVTYTANGNRPPHHGKILNNVLDYAGGNESGKCGINVVYGSVNDILIEGNTVNFAARNGICGNTEGVSIVNNFVNNTLWNGINLAGDNNTIYGNTISGSSRDVAQQASAMLIYGKHNIIENNKIYDNQTVATQYKGIVEIYGADYNIIRNNKFGDTAGGAKLTILGGNTTNLDNYGTGGYRWGILTSKPTNSNIDDEYTNSTSHLKCYKVNSTTWVNLQNWTSIGC